MINLHYQTQHKSGEPVYDALCSRLQTALDPATPIPHDAGERIWVPVFSAHGSQPLVELSTPNLAALGITRAEALKQVATFSSEWDSFGGVGDVVRVSDLTETNVPGLQRALAQMSAPTAPVQKPEGLLRRWFTS